MKQMKSFLVQQYVSESASKTPMKTAATDGQNSISYRDLSSISNRLANCLVQRGVRRQERVLFCLPRSIKCLVAMLGILKADAVYVPIDIKSPHERWKRIVEDCNPVVLICDNYTITTAIKIVAEKGYDLLIISLDPQKDRNESLYSDCVFLDKIYEFNDDEMDFKNEESDSAYILYTSGSTGLPKGVVISHLNIKTYIEWAVNCFDINKNDKILNTAPFHFDMSTFDIYCTFKTGATLCIASDGQLLFPEKLMSYIEEEGITLWKGVSSLLMYLARSGVLNEGRIPTLKQILFAGETLPTKYLIQWMKTFPEKTFYNAYGPTEATGISLYHCIKKVPDSLQERVPIGIPCDDTEVFILNEDNTQTEQGEIGELCIAGPCISKGYLNDHLKTSMVFIEYQFLGLSSKRIYKTGDLAFLNSMGKYEFIGRKDSQVKYMGYRIELGEIENSLLSISGVEDSAVIFAPLEHNGISELIAFFELSKKLSLAEVNVFIKKQLPYYMIPKRLIPIDKIPRCSRGKVCKNTLLNYVKNDRSKEIC